MVSARPIVSGDGPREEPTPTPAVRNSRLATLSARDIVAGDILPRGDGPSPRRDGGLGITIDPVGVEDADCLGGKAGVISPTSENKSPSKRKTKNHADSSSQAYLFLCNFAFSNEKYVSI